MERLTVLLHQLQTSSGNNAIATSPQPQLVSAKPGTYTVTDNSTGRSFVVDAHGASPSDVNFAAMIQNNRPVQFIGAPFADGQNLLGSELAPMAFRDAGLKSMVEKLGRDFLDDGDLFLELPELAEKQQANDKRIETYRQWVRAATQLTYSTWSGDKIRSGDAHVEKVKVEDPYLNLKNGSIIGQSCGLVYQKVLEASSRGDFALTIGGDHSIASATIGALVKTYPQLAVVWVDAHGDANTPDTSPSLHYHGMPAAHLMGWFKKPVPGFEWLESVLAEGRLAYIGLRDIDPEEGSMLRSSGAHIYTMAHVDRLGIAQVVAMALQRIDPQNNRPLHLTFDIDAIDPVYAPGTGTLARGGLSYRESHFICEEMAATHRLVGMDLVEINPLVDHIPERMHGDDLEMAPTSQTIQLGIELVLSALGKNILGQ